MNQEIIELIISAAAVSVAIIALVIIWCNGNKTETALKKQENEFKQKFFELTLENQVKIKVAEEEIQMLKYEITVLNEEYKKLKEKKEND